MPAPGPDEDRQLKARHRKTGTSATTRRWSPTSCCRSASTGRRRRVKPGDRVLDVASGTDNAADVAREGRRRSSRPT